MKGFEAYTEVDMVLRTPAFVFKDGVLSFNPNIMVEQRTLGLREVIQFIGRQDDLAAAGLLQPEMRLQGRQRHNDKGDRWNVIYDGGGKVKLYTW